MSMTLQLEALLHRFQCHGFVSSPFRLPLIRLLNKHPVEAVDHFLPEGKPVALNAALTFLKCVKHPAATKLREHLLSQVGTEQLLNATLAVPYPGPPQAATPPVKPGAQAQAQAQAQSSYRQVAELHLQGLYLVNALVKHRPAYVGEQLVVAQQLLHHWRSEHRAARLKAEESLSIRQQQESRLVVKGLLSYCRRVRSDLTVLFSLLTAFSARTVV
ncbi:MAG: hypothetical protein ACK40L_19595, partial [Hydrogenophaga sp.]